MSLVNVTPRPRRAAPCGAELGTGRTRRLAGAPLYRKVERQVRADLEPWHLPLDDYDCAIKSQRITEGGWFYAITGDVLMATFTHRATGAEIEVTEIWVDDDGEIVQAGTQYGRLSY